MKVGLTKKKKRQFLLEMIKCKDCTDMSEKAANVQETFRKPGELLFKTTLQDYKYIWPLGKKKGVAQDFCTVVYIV